LKIKAFPPEVMHGLVLIQTYGEGGEKTVKNVTIYFSINNCTARD
jgi:hypothetical protein